MNPRPVLHLVSFILLVFAAAMAASTVVGWLLGDTRAQSLGLLTSAVACALLGGGLWALTRKPGELSTRDGIAVVTFGWIAAAIAAALPYILTGSTSRVIDALFESVSGLTTTGASILVDPQAIGRGMLLWRSLTHFFGGMGILVLCVAILPLLGSGGMQLYRAEASGVSQDRLKPRIASTAKAMWIIYILLNAVLIALLRVAGMDWFDSVCHAFATVATGGFSTQSSSIAAYNSLLIESIIAAFMFISATNFALHYRLLHGSFSYSADPEFRFYLGFWLACCGIVTFNIWGAVHDTFGASLRHAVFSTTSLLTTTGFCTDDFDRWPAASKVVLILAMLVGGCAGSTAGALKQIRIVVLLKRVLLGVWQFMHPQAVAQIKLGRAVVEPSTANQISTYFGLYLLVFALANLAMCFFVDGETALSSVVATMGGVGPGFGLAGASETYEPLAFGAKAILILCMLGGRLEFYALAAIFFPRFWRR